MKREWWRMRTERLQTLQTLRSSGEVRVSPKGTTWDYLDPSHVFEGDLRQKQPSTNFNKKPDLAKGLTLSPYHDSNNTSIGTYIRIPTTHDVRCKLEYEIISFISAEIQKLVRSHSSSNFLWEIIFELII